MRERLTARVLLLDPQGRILVMKGRLPSDPTAPGAWFTVGGGVEAGESLAEAALREIREETGFSSAAVGPVLWEGEQIHHDRKGRPVRVLERFMVARCAGGDPRRDGWQALEQEFVDDIRWWTQADLAACDEPVFPADLAERLADILKGEFDGIALSPKALIGSGKRKGRGVGAKGDRLMPSRPTGEVRALALVGPTGAGKTSLMEAMLQAAGESDRKVGDASPEAKARGHSVELNLAGFDFMGDHYAVVDCPGSQELAAEADAALPAVDLAVIVAEPEAAKAVLLQPAVRQLEALGVPRALFVNKMDQARGSLETLLAALAPVSSVPLVARQLPTVENERVTGYVDLALERAFVYRAGQPSQIVDLPPDLAAVEADARFHMLEQLADFDDELMEQLLSDANPARDLVFADLGKDMNEGLIVPVFFGSALNGFGIRRLLKALRHETPPTTRAATRLGIAGPGAAVIKTAWVGQAGKLAFARIFGAALADGAELTLPDGARGRVGGLSGVQGGNLKKIVTAAVGDIIAIGKIDGAKAGDILAQGAAAATWAPRRARSPLYALAIAAANRKDDVRLSSALTRLLEEDPGLTFSQDGESHQSLLAGQGEGHVRLALERLKRRWGVDIAVARPATPYRETIRDGATQRGRHKKQTGGHGQFADVTIDIRPRDRGEGFAFVSRITGGVVPRQWIPAVEQGVRDGLSRGPLGFPVVDVEVTLTDGQFHAVDSSEMAFRIAGKLAVDEGLKACGSRLLEPIDRLKVFVPSSAIAHVNAALSARRGQILGFRPREDWPGWDEIDAYLPQSERHDLIAELRSLTQGLGAFEAEFDHLAELAGRQADEVVAAAKAA